MLCTGMISMLLSLPVHPDYVGQIEVHAAHVERENDIIENGIKDIKELSKPFSTKSLLEPNRRVTGPYAQPGLFFQLINVEF